MVTGDLDLQMRHSFPVPVPPAPTVALLGSQLEAACQIQAATGGFADPDSALPTQSEKPGAHSSRTPDIQSWAI